MLTIVSDGFPPYVSAVAIVMTNLLSSYSGKVSAVSGSNYTATFDPTFASPCPSRRMISSYIHPRIYGGLTRRFPSLVCHAIKESIRRAMAKFNTDALLAVFPFEDCLVAGFLAARESGLPFYAYMHDLWLENTHVNTACRRFAEKWEPIILSEATKVLCVTEVMQSIYEKKYGIQTNLLPHTISENEYLNAPAGLQPARMPNPTVLFVGGINHAFNVDALRVLASASELLPKNYSLLFIAPNHDADTVRSLGIESSRLEVRYVKPVEAKRLASEAHVLVAPLSHKNCPPDEVRMVFSTKLLMYLLSGRPIIVFAPEDSYQAESARRKGWGYVVTEDSPKALAEAIIKINGDYGLAGRLVHGALQEARSRHSERYANYLCEWVNMDISKLSFANRL